MPSCSSTPLVNRMRKLPVGRRSLPSIDRTHTTASATSRDVSSMCRSCSITPEPPRSAADGACSHCGFSAGSLPISELDDVSWTLKQLNGEPSRRFRSRAMDTRARERLLGDLRRQEPRPLLHDELVHGTLASPSGAGAARRASPARHLPSCPSSTRRTAS